MTVERVLLHGFVGGSWSYATVLSALAPSHNALAPTLSYHEPLGNQPLPDLDFAAEVERIAALIAEFGSEPVDLVGYSMGGRLALGLGVAHPELVRRLVLISSRRGLDGQLEREQRQRADEVWSTLLETEGLEAFLERWWAQPLFRSLAGLPGESLKLELGHRRRHHPAGLAAALRRFGLGSQPSYASEMPELRIPVTLVAGALDGKFVALSRQLASELPHGRCVVVEGAGHHLLLEAPSRVARIIDEETER